MLEVGFHRLELTHSTRNELCCRIALQAGFRLEATLRGRGLHADGWHDMHLHARLRGDPDRPEPPATRAAPPAAPGSR